MAATIRQPEITKSALIIVDMQNDFVHSDGGFGCIARDMPQAGIDLPFLMGTVPQVKRLADAFRSARRPVVYLAHVVKPDYSDAQFPYGASVLARQRTAPSSSKVLWARRSWTISSPVAVNT